MNKQDMIKEIALLTEEIKVGMLATTGKDGGADARWMTFAQHREKETYLYAITAPHSKKCDDIQFNHQVTVMLQAPDLQQVIKLKGHAELIDNPSLRSEVFEILGKKLYNFWKLNEETEFIVLEIEIKEAELYRPLKGEKEVSKF